ncbi:GTPase HflX [Halorubrum ezzemoulense]|uniref:GTPase HflX n=2 Tax=Halorubrum TaxID=56688 RepID=A0A256JS27_HALEZ|nr:MULTISPECIES: GTPase HflX [Halorubrum]MDB2245530.1 GTPase HflX [Halorubrum ezzemoulense]MDB2250416.1 GTPase HflX [Halorubrum ezzemoulense]MDB2273221.1 GTPase HflX [Halorubrum ezzemoulense]MDB2279092.1 GTPase HflX [Halorubrum ezzemoulense]MDB2285672.1 GTPase HflX [Halorubrum ezzemoulense]
MSDGAGVGAADADSGTDGRRAVVAKRVDSGAADLSEIRQLAAAAGYDVVGELTQTRTEDAAFMFGEGKVAELRDLVRRADADAVIIDNDVGPYQTFNVGGKLPEGVEVVDRFTLILEIFGQRANTRKAQLQVELAELRYELPRAEAKASLAKRDERPGFMGLGEYDESVERDIKRQISEIRDELASIAEKEEARREQRRDSGFDLVALAGYTNAGKSTLMRRLADELAVDENAERHRDLDTTAESQDMLFTTLGTTTRRAEMEKRDVLLTDTVGFIADLPHWLVESFESTLDSVYRADLVLLVVDASEPVEAMREKLVTSHDTLYERNEAPVVTVFNKIDRLEPGALADKRAALSGVAPDPIAVSAKTGAGVAELRDRVEDELPDWERERLVLPVSDEAMSLVSWVHDHGYVAEETYAGDQVTVDFEAKPSIVARARAKAAEMAAAPAEESA